MKSRRFIFLIVILIVVLPVILYSQPPSGNWNPPDDDPTVPVDGGLFVLLTTAVSYFVVKQFKRKNRR